MSIYQRFLDEQEEKRRKQQAQKQADDLKYRKTYTAKEKKYSGYQTLDDLEAAYGDSRRPVTGNVSYASSSANEIGVTAARLMNRKQNEAEAAYNRQKYLDANPEPAYAYTPPQPKTPEQEYDSGLAEYLQKYPRSTEKAYKLKLALEAKKNPKPSTPSTQSTRTRNTEPNKVSQEEYDRTIAEEQILYPGRVTRAAQERVNAIRRADESRVVDDANYDKELADYLKKYPHSNERAFQMQRAYDSDKGDTAGQKAKSRLQELNKKIGSYLADPDPNKKLPQRIVEGAGAVVGNVGASFVDFGRGQADSMLAATYGAQLAEQGANPFIGSVTAADRQQTQRVIDAYKANGMDLPANFYDKPRGFSAEEADKIIQAVNSGDKNAAQKALEEGINKHRYNTQKAAIENLTDPNFEGNASRDARQRLEASLGGIVASIDAWADVENRSRLVKDIAGGSRSAARTLTYALPYVGLFVGGMDSYKANLTEKVEAAKIEGKEPDYDAIQTYAIGATVIDAATERISNAVAGFQAGSAVLKAAEKPTIGTVLSAAMRGMVKETAEDMFVPTVGRFAGYLAKQSLGEGFEEILAGIGQGLLAKVTTDKDTALSDLITAEDLWSQFVGGAFMGLLFPIVGSTTNFVKSRQMIEHYSGQKISDISPEDMQRVIDTIYNEGQNPEAKAEIKENLAQATVNINKSGQQVVEQRTGQVYDVTNPTVDGTVALQNLADGTTLAVTGEELQAGIQAEIFTPVQPETNQAAPVAAAQAQAPTVDNSSLPIQTDTTGAAPPNAPATLQGAGGGVADVQTISLPSGDREVATSRYTATNGRQANVRAQMTGKNEVVVEVENRSLPVPMRITLNADDFAIAQQTGQNMRQYLMQAAAKSKTNLPVQAQKLAGENAGTLFDAIEAAAGQIIGNRIVERTQAIETQKQAEVMAQAEAEAQVPVNAEQEMQAAFKNKEVSDLTTELEERLYSAADLAQEFRHKQVAEGKFDKAISDALDKVNADLREKNIPAYYGMALEKNITRQQKGIRSILEEATGKKVIYVYGVGVDAVNEFVTDTTTDQIMVNVNNSHLKIAWSIGHGAIHILQDMGLDAEFNKAVEKSLNMNKEEMIAAKIDEYEGYPDYQQDLIDNPEQAYKEYIADRGGQVFNDVDFYERMFEGSKKRKSIVNRLTKWLNKSKEANKGIQSATAEIDAVIDALNKAKEDPVAITSKATKTSKTFLSELDSDMKTAVKEGAGSSIYGYKLINNLNMHANARIDTNAKTIEVSQKWYDADAGERTTVLTHELSHDLYDKWQDKTGLNAVDLAKMDFFGKYDPDKMKYTGIRFDKNAEESAVQFMADLIENPDLKTTSKENYTRFKDAYDYAENMLRIAFDEVAPTGDIMSKAILGNKVESAIRANEYIQAQYAVLDAADLIASHDLAGNLNPNYDATIQPRDRSRVDSKLNINNIINKVDPKLLVGNESVKNGAPVIGTDGMVESGNGRIIAVQEFYRRNNKSAKAYREYLIENADSFGINTDALPDNPVLVRIRTSEVDSRQEFARLANVSEQAKMSASEVAKADAAQLTNALLGLVNTGESGNLNAASNREFIREFSDKIIPESERGDFIQADGSLSATGINRVRNALFFKAYDSPKLLNTLAESTDSNIKTITNSLVKIAPKAITTQQMIDDGKYFDANFTKDLIQAVEKFTNLKATQVAGIDPVEAYIRQQSLMPETDITPSAKKLMSVLYVYKSSGVKLADFLTDLYNGIEAMGDPREQTLMNMQINPSKETLIDRMVEKELLKNGQEAKQPAKGDTISVYEYAGTATRDRSTDSTQQDNTVGEESQSEGQLEQAKVAPASTYDKAQAIEEYEQRQQDRVERLRNKAAKAQKESKARMEASFRIADRIPPGQPILTDHYSAKSHRRDLERMNNHMAKSIEASEKAEYYDYRADAAEKNKAISMDDPAAVEKLTARVAYLENIRENIKAENKRLKAEGKPINPPYVLQNLGANIRATKLRLEQAQKLEAKIIQTGGSKTQTINGVDVVENYEANRLQLQFDGKPDAETISLLKRFGFRWAPSERSWQKHLTRNAMYDANTVFEMAGIIKNRSEGVQYSLDAKALEAIKEFGVTTRLSEAGYILSNGQMLDFSGKRDGAPGFSRTMDHREIADLYPDIKNNTDAMQQFMNDTGSIRVHASENYALADFTGKKPITDEQKTAIVRMLARKPSIDAEVYLDVKQYAPVKSFELDYPTTADVRKMIAEVEAIKKEGSVQYSLDAEALLEKKPPKGMEAHKGNRALRLFKQGTIDQITDAHLFYGIQPNKHTIAIAARQLSENRSLAESRAMNAQDVSPVSQALRIILMRDADQSGEAKLAADYMMVFNKSNMLAGQAVQANKLLTKLSADTITQLAVRRIQEKIKPDEQYKTEVTASETADTLQQLDIEALQHTKALKDIDSLRESVGEFLQGSHDSEVIKKHWDRVIERLEETKQSLVDYDPNPVWEFTDTLHLTASQLMPTLDLPKTSDPTVFMRFVQNNLDKMSEALNLSYDMMKTLHEQNKVFMGELESYFGSLIPNHRPPANYLRTELTPELFEKLRQQVIEHYEQDYHTFNSMVRRLMDIDINAADAVTMAREIKKQINLLTREEKIRALQMVLPVGDKSVPWLMKLVNMSNEGKMTDADLQAFISKASGLPGATPDAINYIRNLAKEIEEINSVASMEGRRLTREEQRKVDVLQAFIGKRIMEEHKSSVGAKIDYVDSMFLMSRPKTGIRNIVGNTGFGLVDTFIVDPIAAAIDKHIISKFTGEVKVPAPQLKALRDGLVRGVKESYYDITNEIYTSSIATQWDMPKGAVLTSKVGRLANMMFRLAMELPDRAYQVAYYESSLAGQMKIANVTQPTMEMEEVALYDAMRKTFADDSKLAKTFSNVKRGLNFGKGFGLGSLVVKFPRTPANLVMRSIEYSPVGFFNALYDLAKPMMYAKKYKNIGATFEDGFNQKHFVQSLTRGTIGSVVTIGLGAFLTSMGLMVGRLPDDEEEKAALKNAGIARNYMINWTGLWRYVTSGFNPVATLKQEGDMWGTYSWFSPMNIGIGIGANLVEDMKDISAADADKFDAVWSAAVGSMSSGIASVSEMSLMSGVNRFINRFAYNENDPIKAAYDTMLELPSRLVPGIVTGFKEMIDNSYRTTGRPNDGLVYAYNLMKQKLPGASFTLPPQVNEFGNLEEVYQNNGNNIWNVFFNPSNIYDWKPDDATLMVLAVMAEAKEAGIPKKERSGLLPADSYSFPRVLEYKTVGDPISLTDEERVMLTKQINERVVESWKRIPAKATVEEKIKQMQKSQTEIAQSIKKAYQAKKLAEQKKLSRKTADDLAEKAKSAK